MVKLYPNADGVAASGSTTRMTFGHYVPLKVTAVRLSSFSVSRSFTSFRMTCEDNDDKFST